MTDALTYGKILPGDMIVPAYSITDKFIIVLAVAFTPLLGAASVSLTCIGLDMKRVSNWSVIAATPVVSYHVFRRGRRLK